MKLSQILTAPNQLILLRMIFVPVIVTNLVEGRYAWALAVFVIAGFSDGLDGLLARRLHQQTLLGQYLDPIADKLLLSTVFLVLSILHKIAWKYTILVFSRDISILAASAVLFAIAGSRDFRQHFRQGEYPVPDHRAIFCDVAGDLPATLGADYAYNVPARDCLVYRDFRTALLDSRPETAARTHAFFAVCRTFAVVSYLTALFLEP